jgi:hypothetical protein
MSAPADVLAVLKAAADRALIDGEGADVALHMDVCRTHDAVAELIAADREYDDAIAAAKELNRKVAESGWFEVEFDALRKSGVRIVRAPMRRAKALDVIGGAA